MPSLKRLSRRNKHQAHVDRPVIITSNFELQYEEVLRRNRFAIIAFLATGLLAVAAFIPAAVYQTTADNQRVTAEVESGKITNPAQVTVIHGDSAAGGDSYVEFGN
ncbi:hypothetical protein BH10PAT3_BH10PAT3_1410 [soil metagenome]